MVDRGALVTSRGLPLLRRKPTTVPALVGMTSAMGVSVGSARGGGGPRTTSALCRGPLKRARHSGAGGSTRELLERVGAWRLDDVDSFEACIDPLAAETDAFIEAFRGGDVARILTQAAQLQEELVFFDRVGELGILPLGPSQLAGAIEDAGAIARTSGAGGGDCMWALSDDPAIIERASDAAAELGFARLDVELAGPGARLDAQ